MADAVIEKVGPGEYEMIRGMYNAIFNPQVDRSFFDRRLEHHPEVLVLVAQLDGQPVGFSCGYELRPSTYYTWLCGVVPDARRMGIATQLMAAVQAWAIEHRYEMARFECYNQHRPMLLFAIKNGYDIVGVRWDARTAGNHVIFERQLI